MNSFFPRISSHSVCTCMFMFVFACVSSINSRSVGFHKEGGSLKNSVLVRCFSQASQKALENFAANSHQRFSSHSCTTALPLLSSSLVSLDSVTGMMY